MLYLLFFFLIPYFKKNKKKKNLFCTCTRYMYILNIYLCSFTQRLLVGTPIITTTARY